MDDFQDFIDHSERFEVNPFHPAGTADTCSRVNDDYIGSNILTNFINPFNRLGIETRKMI